VAGAVIFGARTAIEVTVLSLLLRSRSGLPSASVSGTAEGLDPRFVVHGRCGVPSLILAIVIRSGATRSGQRRRDAAWRLIVSRILPGGGATM